MKNNMKKLRLALFSALVCLFLQSCNDFLDVDPKHAGFPNNGRLLKILDQH